MNSLTSTRWHPRQLTEFAKDTRPRIGLSKASAPSFLWMDDLCFSPHTSNLCCHMPCAALLPALLVASIRATFATGGFRALVLTDAHYDELYLGGSDPTTACHRGAGAAGEFGVRNKVCDTPKATISAVLSDINSTVPYDAVFYLGDSGRHALDKSLQLTAEQLYGQVASVAVGIRNAVHGSIPILPTIGNNDIYPKDDLPPGPNSSLDSVARCYLSVMPRDSVASFHANGSYVFRVPNQLIVVISVNTLYFGKLNSVVQSCKYDSSPGAAQMTWLRRQLQLVADAGLRAIIIGHVPPSQWRQGCVDQYVSICSDFSRTLSAHLYAHRHYDTFYLLSSDGSVAEPPGGPRVAEPQAKALLRGRLGSGGAGIIGDGNPSPVAVALVAPSVMPHFNPTFRVMQFAADGSLDDYTQYYYDLAAGNAAGALKVKQEYSARSAYPALGANGLTPTGYSALFQDILGNSSIASLYGKYAAVSATAALSSPHELTHV